MFNIYIVSFLKCIKYQYTNKILFFIYSYTKNRSQKIWHTLGYKNKIYKNKIYKNKIYKNNDVKITFLKKII